MDEEKKQWGDHEESLFAAHRHMVHGAVAAYTFQNSTYHDDLYSYGLYGLWRAVDEYRPDKGMSFKTWAGKKIRWAMKDGLRDLDTISRTNRDEVKSMALMFNVLAQKHQELPTWKQLRDSGVNVDQAVQAARFANQGEPDLDFWLNEKSGPGPDHEVINHDIELRMAKYIAALPEQMSILIELRYYEQLTMSEIGEVLGVSESRVSQIHSSALQRLRNMIGTEFRDY